MQHRFRLQSIWFLSIAVLPWLGCGDKDSDSGTNNANTTTANPTATTTPETTGGTTDGGATDGGATDGGATDGGATDGGGTAGTTDGTTTGTTDGGGTAGGTDGSSSEPCAGATIGTAVGECALDFTLVDRSGVEVNLWAHQGDVIYLDLSGFT